MNVFGAILVLKLLNMLRFLNAAENSQKKVWKEDTISQSL